MVVKTLKPHLLILICALVFSFGFKIQQKYKWNISPDDPTVWLDVDPDVMAFSFSSIKFDDGSEILEDVADEDQARTILNAIINDYNSISTSYLRLALPDSPAAEDSDIASFDSNDRKIKIVFGTPAAFGAIGYASFSGSGSKMSGCTITLQRSAVGMAQIFKGTLTHELGHCMALDHNHADRDSIMSYSRPMAMHYLGADEKIAMTYLYPRDNAYAKEVATLGMSCNRQ